VRLPALQVRNSHVTLSGEIPQIFKRPRWRLYLWCDKYVGSSADLWSGPFIDHGAGGFVNIRRAVLTGVASTALMAGMLTPIIVAPAAQAATIIPITDADCTSPQTSPPPPIVGNSGDVVEITANLAGCTRLFVTKTIVDDSTAITVTGPNVTIIDFSPTVWRVDSDDTSVSITKVEVTLGGTATAPLPAFHYIEVTDGGPTNLTAWSVTIRGSTPGPTPPTPATPPSAPASAEATAGNGEATVSWTAPTSQGSFPVTNYQVQSTPSSKGCLVPVTATTCRIAGLRNGTVYTFQVRALNGGGWGSWATTESVVPRPKPDPEASIMITGSRSANDRVARVTGATTGLTGATLQAMVRLSTQTEFAAGSVRQVNAQGEFAWQRRVAATASVQVYFTAGAVTSNTVTIEERR
jgi:hypothetical protein